MHDPLLASMTCPNNYMISSTRTNLTLCGMHVLFIELVLICGIFGILYQRIVRILCIKLLWKFLKVNYWIIIRYFYCTYFNKSPLTTITLSIRSLWRHYVSNRRITSRCPQQGPGGQMRAARTYQNTQELQHVLTI